MRWVRLAIAALVPVEMVLYVPPPGIESPLDPRAASLGVVAALVTLTVVSVVVHRRGLQDLRRWARVEIACDAIITLGILQVFAFDQFSSMWTILLVVVLEGAFREGLRGAMVAWFGSGIVYAGIQVGAALAHPLTAPLDPGSILFRALVTGAVAFVAGSLASQLESAVVSLRASVEQHRAGELALAEQYADLRLIGRVSRAIAAGPGARREVCNAVQELSGAELVMLYEPDDDVLRCTAAAGCANGLLPPLELDDPTSGTARAFRTGQRQLATDAELPRAFARVAARFQATSAVFVPVVRDGRSVAALTLTFRERVEELSPRIASALEVMSEEAAVAIIRADLAASLETEARRDTLTGLVNRRGMEEALETEMQRARRTAAPLTVLMLDLDGLKVFNDTYGHQAGDRLIVAAAAGWLARLRPTDVLARYGGDEFVALLPGCDEDRAMQVAAALLAALPMGSRASVGAASWDHAEDASALLARADDALYSGKRAGGGQVVPALAAVPKPRRAPKSRTASRPA